MPREARPIVRLDGRQIRFSIPFWPTWRTRTLRLGGRRGNLYLQEPALVIEGELLRFRLFGIEWLFRRALSEWTTVTVPYSRIVAVRLTRSRLIRFSMILAVVLAWAGTGVLFWLEPEVDPYTAGLAGILTVLCGFIYLRVRPMVTVVYQPKAGRRTRLTIWVRKRAARQAFLDTLAGHRATAGQHALPAPDGA
jgi:hypothetical protein